jgi:UDP-N-acetylglucosamine 2-epimerase
VVFSNGDTESFCAALDCVESEEFRLVMRTLANPYGDGHSEARAVELLKQINFGALLKKSEDPLHVHP